MTAIAAVPKRVVEVVTEQAHPISLSLVFLLSGAGGLLAELLQRLVGRAVSVHRYPPFNINFIIILPLGLEVTSNKFSNKVVKLLIGAITSIRPIANRYRSYLGRLSMVGED